MTPSEQPGGITFERRISFPRAAFEKRHDDPSRDYGIGCVMLRFALIGPTGAISFDVFTGWYLPHVAERLRKETRHQAYPHTPGRMMRCALEGHGGAMYVHSPQQMFDHDPQPGECDLLPGGKCWGDVGFSIGDTLFDALVEGGEDALWAAMGKQYRYQFTESEPLQARAET